MGEIRQRPRARNAGLVELLGEFDARDLQELCEILDAAGERDAVVDLSGVTFLDVQSTRELAARLRLHQGNLRFRRPSWAVRASVAACGYEPWFGLDPAESGDRKAAGLRERC